MKLQIVEVGLKQGADEEIAYQLTTTNWGSSPSSVSVKAYDMSDSFADVTSTILSGSASVASDVITLPVVLDLTAGNKYRIEIMFTTGGNVLECYFELEGMR